MRPEQIPYGVKDFKRIRLENLYYVDKTAYIRELEARANFVFFARPRRFGKTLLCEMLRCYYDIAEKENFEKLFGDLAIGRNPTALANRYVVLPFDFSCVNAFEGADGSAKFTAYMNSRLDGIIADHRTLFAGDEKVEAAFLGSDAGAKYNAIVGATHRLGLGVYVIVDEYDNFTNEIVSSLGKLPYKEITHGTGFYRGWFKQFKATCARNTRSAVLP